MLWQLLSVLLSALAAYFLARAGVGLTPQEIASLCQTRYNYSLPLVTALANQAADARVGTSLLLASLVLSIVAVVGLYPSAFGLARAAQVVVALILAVVAFAAADWIARRRSAETVSQVRAIVEGPEPVAPSRVAPTATPLGPAELHEWSRHYDTIQWAVTGILLAAAGGLMAFYLSLPTAASPPGSTPSAQQLPRWIIPIIGMILTLLTLFFVANFRQLRRRVHQRVLALGHETIDAIVSGRRVAQWPVFAWLLTGFTGVWFWLLYQQQALPDLVLMGLGLAAVAWVAYCMNAGWTTGAR